MAKSQKMLNRVMVLKLSEVQSGPFDAIFRRSARATQLLFNEMAVWGHDTITSKATNPLTGAPVFVETELISQRKALYEATDKSLTYENFSKALRLLYMALASFPSSKGMTSVLIGNPKIQEKMTPEDWTSVDSLIAKNADSTKICEVKDLLYRISNTLKATGLRNREPYTLNLSAGERCSVVGNVHRRLTSWVAVCKTTTENYNDEELEISNDYAEIDTAIRPSLKRFFDTCIDKDIISHFDERVRLYLKDCVIPALKSGKEITDHFFFGKREERVPYSLHTDFVELLKGLPELWIGDDPVILRTIFLLEKLMTHESHRPNSVYPLIKDGDTHHFSYLLGSNYTKYVAAGIGTPIEEDVTIEAKRTKEIVVLSDGKCIQNINISISRGDGDATDYTFKLHTQDRYHGGSYKPNTYLNGVSMWTNVSKQFMFLRFKRKSVLVDAIVKEPSVICKNGEFFLRLNMTVLVDANEEVDALKWYLSTAAPSTKTDRASLKEEPKNIERFELLKGNTYKLLGVDLGLRSPFAWAVGETTISGVANSVNILSSGELNTPPDPTYTTLLSDLKNIGRVMGITKSLAMGKQASFNTSILETIQNAQTFFSTYTACGPRKQAVYTTFCADKDPLASLTLLLIKHTNDLVAVKKDPKYIGSLLLHYVDLVFGKLKDQRRMHLKDRDVMSKFSQEFLWLRILEQQKRVRRSISDLGTDNTRTSIIMKDLSTYYNSCKRNFLKQLASAIVDVAYKNGCKIIVLEELNGPNKPLTKRSENFLQAFWSPAILKGAIENAAHWYGIAVAEVSEQQTSQVHHETGKFGYRKNASPLSYMDEGGLVQTVNADINAAKNIVARFVSRHTDLRLVNLKNVTEGQGKRLKNVTEGQGKRLKGFLTHHFGTVNKALEYFKNKGAEEFLWYHNGEEWISKDQRNEYVDDIKNVVEGRVKVGFRAAS